MRMLENENKSSKECLLIVIFHPLRGVGITKRVIVLQNTFMKSMFVKMNVMISLKIQRGLNVTCDSLYPDMKMWN